MFSINPMYIFVISIAILLKMIFKGFTHNINTWKHEVITSKTGVTFL